MATMILAHVAVEGAHQLRADESERRGGTNTGPSPFELMLSGLGACTAITLRMYSERKRWDLGKITVGLRLVKEGDEETNIERKTSVSEKIDAGQREKLLEIANKTPVSRILAAGVPITTVIETPS